MKTTEVSQIQEIKIESLDQLKTTLENITLDDVSSSSKALHTTLTLQLKVVNQINASTLIDSSFDLIFADFKKALKLSTDEYERDIIREKVQLFIHSYIFFLDAKLCYMLKKDKENGEELLSKAANLLAENSADLILLASGRGAGKVIVSKLAKEILTKAKNDPNLIKKVINWYNKEERQRNASNNFLKTLDLLFKKLDNHKKSLGKSDIIHGLFERWTKDIIDYRTSGVKISGLGFFIGLCITMLIVSLSLTFFLNVNINNVMDFSLKNKIYIAIFCTILTIIISLISSKFIDRLIVKIKINKLKKHYADF